MRGVSGQAVVLTQFLSSVIPQTTASPAETREKTAPFTFRHFGDLGWTATCSCQWFQFSTVWLFGYISSHLPTSSMVPTCPQNHILSPIEKKKSTHKKKEQNKSWPPKIYQMKKKTIIPLAKKTKNIPTATTSWVIFC